MVGEREYGSEAETVPGMQGVIEAVVDPVREVVKLGAVQGG